MFRSLVVVRGWVMGPVFGSWVTAWISSGCGLWVVDRRGWVVVVDRRAGMNGSDRKSTRLNSSHLTASRMPSSA